MSEHHTPNRPTSRMPLGERTVSLPVSLVTSALCAMIAGGGGSLVTSTSIAAEFREFRIEIKGQLDSIQRDAVRAAQDHATAIARMEREAGERERRLRELELWRAREDARNGLAPR